MIRVNTTKYLPYVLVPIAIDTIEGAATFPIGNTTLWWIIELSIILLLWSSTKYLFNRENKKSMVFINLYIVWIIFGFFHGLFMSDNYWDWKVLIDNTLMLLLIILSYVATNEEVVRIIITNYLKFALPFFFLFAPFIYSMSFGEYLAPMSFLLFFLPVMKFKNKVFIIFFVLFVIISDLTARSNVVKFGAPIILLSIYYLRFIIPQIFLEILRWFLMLIPIVLFYLAIAGIFNPFDMDNYVSGEHTETKKDRAGNEVTESLTADTRTFLYQEVINSARIHNSWIIGRSQARGNDTEAFGDWAEGITGRRERSNNEVAILNIFNWFGIIGILIYFIVFSSASHLAIMHSNNIFSKMLGIFIAFRWTYLWVEDFHAFNLNNAMLFIMIGLCISRSFRSLSNEDVKLWAQKILNFRYL